MVIFMKPMKAFLSFKKVKVYFLRTPLRNLGLNIPKKISLDDKELALATELVRHFFGKFNIDSYHDEFRDALMELIKAKIAGKEIKVAPRKEAEKVISLMDALKKSLAKGAKKKAG